MTCALDSATQDRGGARLDSHRGARHPSLSLLAALLILMIAIGVTTPLEFPWSQDNITTQDYISSTQHGSMSKEAAVLVIALMSAFILWHTRPIRWQKRNMTGTTLILSFAVSSLSVLWADDTFLAFKRVVVLWVLIATILALGAALSYYQLAALAALGCSAVVVLAVLTDVITGTFSPFAPDYRLAGVLHPNDVARYCSLLIFALLCLSNGSRHRTVLLVSIAPAALCLVLTHSLTSLVSVLVATIVYFALVSSRRAKALVLAVCIMTAICGFLYPPRVKPTTILALEHSGTRSDSTLLARVDLWREAMEYIELRPLLGYGYGAFWTPERIGRFASDQDWTFGTAHSEYVETALQYGLTGPLLYLCILGSALVYAVRSYYRTRSDGALFVTVISVWLLCTSLTESMGLSPQFAVLVSYSLLAKQAFFTQTAGMVDSRPCHKSPVG